METTNHSSSPHSVASSIQKSKRPLYLSLLATLSLITLLSLVFVFLFPSNPNSPSPSTAPSITGTPELVAGFPTIPTYPQSRLQRSSAPNPNTGDGYRALWISHDSPADIILWYHQSLAATGWQLPDVDRLDSQAPNPSLQASNATHTFYLNLKNDDDDDPTEIFVELETGTAGL